MFIISYFHETCNPVLRLGSCPKFNRNTGSLSYPLWTCPRVLSLLCCIYVPRFLPSLDLSPGSLFSSSLEVSTLLYLCRILLTSSSSVSSVRTELLGDMGRARPKNRKLYMLKQSQKCRKLFPFKGALNSNCWI